MSFQSIFFNWYLSNEKTAFVDKSRVEPTIFFIEKISFSLKLFSGHFYGQSFIKTVRGPCITDCQNIHVYGEKVLLYQFSKAGVRMKLATIIGV